MQERYLVTADLGSCNTSLSVAKVTGDNIQVLFYKEKPSDGVRYSAVYNPVKASRVLGSLIKEAESELGIKILKVVVGLPKFQIRSENASGRLERSDADSCISQEEVDNLKDLASEYPLSDNASEEIYGAVAQSFSADDLIQQSEQDVVGATAAILDGNFKFFLGRRKDSKNIDNVLNQLDIAAAAKVFTPICTGDAVLTEEEKINGVALIELGGGTTSLSIFQGGLMRYFCSIPFGAKNITTDIKYECGFKESLAENIKLAYGACLPDRLQSLSEKVLRINDEETGLYDDLSIRHLSEIITCRIDEILDAIFFRIKESGFAERLRNGIVITGGGANLTNLSYMMQDKCGCNVRIGYPRGRNFSASGLSGLGETGAAATIGMLLVAKKNQYINCTIDEEEPEPPVTQAAACTEAVSTADGSSDDKVTTAAVGGAASDGGQQAADNVFAGIGSAASTELSSDGSAGSRRSKDLFEGTVFAASEPDEDEREEARRRKAEEKERKRRAKELEKEKKRKSKEENKKSFISLTWIKDGLSNVLETVGTMYDSTENEEEEENQN